MEHRKLDALMSPMERIARVAVAGVSASRAQQTSPSGAISLDNADGTRTIIGEVSNGEENPSYTMATHVGDTTPPGIPTGITATSRSGVVVVEWDGTLSGGIPDDFFCVRIFLDGTELGALSEAGSVASAKLQSGTTHSITATSEDDCCLPDGTPAHNVSDATQAISVTVAKDASEVMADIDEQIEGVEQEIADFKANTYTKVQVDKKVQDLDDEISTELTTNYYNRNQIDTTYATKTLVSQTKDAIELSASQTYANKGAGNPNLSPFYAHDLSDVYDATDNPDGYWTETPARATQLDDGWAHIVLDNSSGTGTMYSRTYIRPMADVPDNATLLIEMRNLDTDVTSTTEDPRLWFNASATNSQMWRNVAYFAEDGTYRFPLAKTGNANPTHFARWWWGINRGARAEFDVRISVYANETTIIDGQQVTLPYEGSFKPYVTDQQALGKTYATNSALTVGLDGIRQEVASEYQSIDAMGAYSTTAEMNTAIQTSATGIEQSVAATYSTKQATADAIAAIQVGGRNLITLENTYNGFLNASGGLSAVDYSSPRATGWIPSEPGTQYCLQGWTDVPAGRKHWLGICFYDSTKALIGSRITKEGADGEDYILLKATAPDGAAYVRASWRTYLAPDARAKLEAGTTPTDYTAAPEDLVARSNLTPFGSHDLTDVYDTTSNPDGYWTLFSASPYLTQLSDGWLHFERVNSTSSVVGAGVQVQPIEDVGEGELLTVLIEVRNNQSTTPASTGNFDDLYVQQIANSQLWGDAVQASTLGNATDVKISTNGESFEKRFTKVTDSAHVSGDYTQAFRINIRNGANQTLDFDFRISIYRGGYEGGYVPYSIEDTTLSKTYTKSSTFTQTVDGLDGRITATEDGLAVQETLIRQYAGGVLVAYTGNPVGALVNAAGQYDIVSLTWQDGEPTVTGTLSTFASNLVELGKNGLTSVIEMVSGLLSISHVVNQAYATGGYSQIESQRGLTLIGADYTDMRAIVPNGRSTIAEIGSYMQWSGTPPVPLPYEAESHVRCYANPLDANATRVDISAQTANDSGTLHDASVIVDALSGRVLVDGDGGALAVGPSGVSIGDGTPMRGLYFGTTVVSFSGTTKQVWTSAQFATQFGRAPKLGDQVIFTSGDAGASAGLLVSSEMNLSGGATVTGITARLSGSKSGSVRLNYLVILGA